MKGIFNLKGFAEKADDDILESSITESNEEFGSKCPSCNPTVDFDSSATGAHDKNVTIPGGLKETPNAKPADGEHGVTVPGGNGETPSAKPYDNSSITIPGKTTLTADAYNSALNLLKKSFKEGAEIIEMLENVEVVNKTLDELQAEYTEMCLDLALLESYENGPIFESVKKADKGDIKSIVSKIRKPITKKLKEKNIAFYQPHYIVRLLTMPGNGGSDIKQIWSTRLWQVLGIAHIEDGNINDITAELTEEFSDKLNSYKILAVKAVPAIADVFKTKFGWKNNKNVYFLLVDEKIPADLKSAQKEIGEGLKSSKASADKKEDEKESKKDKKEDED